MHNAYITLEQARDHLRVDYPLSSDDNDLESKVDQACAIVRDYLNLADDAYMSSAGDPQNVPAHILAATFLVLGELYKEREAGADPISPGVVRLLSRSRDPVLA